MSTRVPKLYKLSLEKFLKMFFAANDYKTITMIYQDLPDLKNMLLPIENKMADNQFSKKEILRRAEEKFYDSSYKYMSSVKK